MPSAFAQAVSQSRSVDVYQDGSNTSHAYIRLLYSLPAVVGEDGITYRPVDMGAGVAWANKNVGAADSTQVGSYFFWGGTNAITTSSNTAYYASVNDISVTSSAASEQYALPNEADAAYVNMGSRWRMPTATEMANLINTTTYVTFSQTSPKYNYFISNKFDDSQAIYIPATGRLQTNNSAAVASPLAVFLRTGVKAAGSNAASKVWHLYNQTQYGNDKTAANNSLSWYGEAVRAVYVPPFETCTLTVDIYADGEYQAFYTYICEVGQSITLTANATEGSLFRRWATFATDGEEVSANPDLTVTVTEDASYCAVFEESDEGRTIAATVAPFNGGEVHIQTCLLSHLICASVEVEGINHVVTEFFEPEDLD